MFVLHVLVVEDHSELGGEDGESENSNSHHLRILSHSSEHELCTQRKKHARYPKFAAEKNMRHPKPCDGFEFTDHLTFVIPSGMII